MKILRDFLIWQNPFKEATVNSKRYKVNVEIKKKTLFPFWKIR